MFPRTIGALVIAAATASTAKAGFIDFTGVTLSGSNPYTFNDPTAGEVTLAYSGGFRVEGITTLFGGTSLVGLGSTAQPATLTVSWETPVESIDVRLYDLDLREYDDFEIADGTSLSLVSANPFGPGAPLDGLRVTGSTGDLPNGAANNFTAVRISGDAFTEFSVTFIRPGAPSGAHAIGFGEFVVPAPGSVAVLGLAGLGAIRRRR
ncbi:MAG: hypothetical protein AAGJ54_09725 [Planctomycetota bacterium]